MKILVLSICLLIGMLASAQRKMPNLSFKHNSVEFANANRSMDADGQFADTLHDDRLLVGLVKILSDHPQLQIELVGHTALNEDITWAIKRAATVKSKLVNTGIEDSRISISSKGSSEPIISNKTILSLQSSIEKEAANQRNRRVEIKVVGKSEAE